MGRPTIFFRQNTWGAFPLFFQRGAELGTSPNTLDKVRSIRLRLPIGMFLHKICVDMGDEFQKDDGIPGMMIAQCGHETGRQRV